MPTKKYDYTKEPPKDKTQLNKESMFAYCENLGDNDLSWFIDLLDKNIIKKKNNLDGGKMIDGYNLPVIREEFAKKYFPSISADVKKEKKKATSKKPSFDDKLKAARERLKGNK